MNCADACGESVLDSWPMPFSPSDLPWWGWLLCAGGAGLVCFFSATYASSEKGGCLSGVIAFISGFAGLICGVIGIVRFVKWIWEG